MAKPNFNVTNGDNGSKVFWLYDDFGPSHMGMISGEDFAAELDKIPKSAPLNIRVNSIGGQVKEALAIYNLLNNHPGAKVCDVDSVAASAASLVCMACGTIRMAANSCLMIHNSAVDTSGTKEQLTKDADTLAMIDRQMADIYAKRTGLPLDKITAMMKEESWLDAPTCVALGFADEISQPLKVAACAIPAGRFKHPPAHFMAIGEHVEAPAEEAPIDNKQPGALSALTLWAEAERQRLV